MIYIGEHKGYQVYENDQGFLEGYKSIGIIMQNDKVKSAKRSERIVSNTSDIKVFIENFLTKKRNSKEVPYDPNKDPKQSKLL